MCPANALSYKKIARAGTNTSDFVKLCGPIRMLIWRAAPFPMCDVYLLLYCSVIGNGCATSRHALTSCAALTLSGGTSCQVIFMKNQGTPQSIVMASFPMISLVFMSTESLGSLVHVQSTHGQEDGPGGRKIHATPKQIKKRNH